jgi:uncharacterized Zn finger protein
MYEDKSAWPIRCAGCRNEFTQTVRELRAKNAVRCPECGCLHTYTSEAFEDALARANRNEFDPWGKMLRLRRRP